MKIYAVGIGPGGRDLLTPRSKEALQSSDIIIGHAPYISQIEDLIENKTIISSGMRREIERCEEAIKKAEEGHIVAVVSSGDAGIYGMGGLLLELASEKKVKIEIEILPGITAANGAASVLGAPLMNDFAVISLSDLLTPIEVIRKRITKIAEADLVCVLYNPSSRKRKELIQEVISEICEVRTREIVCGIVKNATRTNEEKWIGTISDFPFEMLDMSSVVIIGNSQTTIIDNKMITSRGYKISR
jgi:precorrin-3B C17-methyltransferase